MMAVLGYGLKSLLSVYLSFSLNKLGVPAVEGRSITHCRFIAKVPIIWPPSLHYEPYLSDETGNAMSYLKKEENWCRERLGNNNTTKMFWEYGTIRKSYSNCRNKCKLPMSMCLITKTYDLHLSIFFAVYVYHD